MTTYYINTTSTGSGDGTTQATSGANAAWKDFSEITGEGAGDSILLNKGDTWRETLTVGASGSSGSPITFGAYGSGADSLINGADLVATWSQYLATDIYSASCNWSANILMEDDTILSFVAWDTDIATTAAAMSASTWTLDTTNDLVYVWASDNADPDTHTMDVGTRQYGVNIGNYDYIPVEILELKYFGTGYAGGVFINKTGTYNIVDNCTIHGLALDDTSGTGDGIRCFGSYNIFKYNTVYDCCHNCININANSDTDIVGNVIEYNTLYDAHHNILDIKCATGQTADIRDTIVRYNIFYHSDTYAGPTANGIFTRGISGDGTTATNTQIYHNIFYNIDDDCIQTDEEVDDIYIYNNVFYNSGGYHIIHAHTGDVGEDFTCEITNNIGHTESSGVFRIDDSTNKTVNYNCWYNAGGFVANVDGIGYTDFATYQVGTGFDSDSIFQDPLFVDAANSNFHLKSSSPCLGIGRYPDEFPLSRARGDRFVDRSAFARTRSRF